MVRSSRAAACRRVVAGALVAASLVTAGCGLTESEGDLVRTAGGWTPHAAVRLPNSLAADFTRWQSSAPGQVGLAVMPLGGNRITVFGDWSSGAAWSTIKVPLALAALRADPEGALDTAEASITVSDNDAADALWNSLGGGLAAARAVEDVLAEAGNPTTGVAGPRTELDYHAFGATEWSLTDQIRFASRLPCLPGAEPVVRMMGEITAEHTWGLGAFADARFKGGWGPDDGTGVYLVRQFGVVPAPGGRLAVAFAAEADSGGFEDAVALLDDLAALIHRHLDELPGGTC
ncbi:hypothetical protein DFR74_101897 [Nocardia puris]|uniref:Beta-lactamase class A n=1 Tax=Nocardia puris TaxID=208602 RepID=A0A366E643_9NOCA|nr:hypothetical protein DFR74_101897 [Nocardia puris]